MIFKECATGVSFIGKKRGQKHKGTGKKRCQVAPAQAARGGLGLLCKLGLQEHAWEVIASNSLRSHRFENRCHPAKIWNALQSKQLR
jgi:hypothetical protein